MNTADWALVISICSAAISLGALAWNVWSTFIFPKPRVRVSFSINRMVPDHQHIGKFLTLSATNEGPNKVILSYVAVRTRPDPKTGSRYGVVNPLHNFPIQTNHTIGPFSGGLPKPLEVGDSFSAYFPYAAEKTFLADDLKQIGFFDTFHRHHWAPRRDLKNVLAKYKKEIGTVAPTNADLKRDDGAGLVPDITT